MLDLMGLSPSSTVLNEFAEIRELFKAVESESLYLKHCQIKPDIVYSLRKRIPISQAQFVDPLFASFLSQNPGLVPDAEVKWNHSSCDDESMAKAIAKYCRPFPNPSSDDLFLDDLAFQWVLKIIYPVTKNSHPISPTMSIRNSELDRSPGPLWRDAWKTKEECVLDPQFLSYFHRYYDSLFQPHGEWTLWGAFLKDELRLEEKVKDKNTRLFICAPSEHHFALRSVSETFNEKLIASSQGFLTPVAVGLNPYNGGFNQLGHNLAERASRFFADIGKFDSSVYSHWLFQCAWLRYQCLPVSFQTYEYLCCFANLYRDIIWTPVMLPDGNVVILLHEPSGQYNTAIDNSLILVYLQILTYLMAGGKRDFAYFKEKHFLCCFGDDSAVGSDTPYLTAENFARALHSRGLEVEFAKHWEFLGNYICWNSNLDVYVPVFSYHKVLSSLLYQGSDDIPSLVSKAMNLRAQCWSNSSAFFILDSYCSWLLANYPQFVDLAASYHPVEVLKNKFVGPTVLKVGQPNISLPKYIPQSMQSQPNPNSTFNGPNGNQVRNKSAIQNRSGRSAQNTNLSNSAVRGGNSSQPNKKKKNKNRNKGNSSLMRSSNSNSLPRREYGINKIGMGLSDFFNRQFSADPEVLRFLAMAVSPGTADLACLPDSSIPRYPIRGVVVLDVSPILEVNPGQADINYAYSIAVQAKFGSQAVTESMHVLYYQPTTAGPAGQFFGMGANYNLLANYAQTSGTSDLSKWTYAQRVVDQAPGYFRLLNAGGPTVAPFGPTPIIDPSSYVFNWSLGSFPAANQYDLSISSGVFLFEWTSVTVAANNCTITALQDCTVTLEQAASSPDGFLANLVYKVRTTGNAPRVRFTNPTGSNVTFSSLNVSRAEFSDVDPQYNGGSISTVRCTAQSIFATYIGTTFNNGGMIAGAQLRPDSLSENYLNQGSTQTLGNAHEVESLMRYDKAYSGPMKNGAYVFRIPWNEQALEFSDANDLNLKDSGALVISGRGSPQTSGATPTYTALRLFITTVFEVQSSDTFFPGQVCTTGSVQKRDYIRNVLMTLKNAQPNGKHLDAFKEWLSNTYGWVKRNSGAIGTAAKASMTAIETILPLLI